MSRGLGKVQRAVLDALLEQPTGAFQGWTHVAALARRAFDTPEPTRAQIESVRRAMKSLAAEGIVDLDHMPEDVWVRQAVYDGGPGIGTIHRQRHLGDRRQLFAHLKLSVEERASVEEWLDKLVEIDRRIG